MTWYGALFGLQLKRKREEEERKQREAAEKARVAELERLAAEKAIKLVEEEEKLKFKDNEMGVCGSTLVGAEIPAVSKAAIGFETTYVFATARSARASQRSQSVGRVG
jgi:hypothetical protein